MNEEINYTSAAFMQVTTNKIETQDKRIVAVEEKINSISDNTQLIERLISTLESLRVDVRNNQFPTEEVKELSVILDSSMSIYKLLLKNKILHHHHVPKMIWITAGLFIILTVVCAGWYSTANQLDGYIANDTKYRQLRLDTAHRGLQFYLDLTDSSYNVNPNMRNIVLKTEELNRENFERLRRAEHLKAEANELERAVMKK